VIGTLFAIEMTWKKCPNQPEFETIIIFKIIINYDKTSHYG